MSEGEKAAFPTGLDKEHLSLGWAKRAARHTASLLVTPSVNDTIT